MGTLKDISNQKIGYLTAIVPIRDYDNRISWRCRCDCGKEIVVNGSNLRCGKVKSCGCKRKELVGKSNTKDKTGQRIGSLTVLGPTDQRKSGSIVWKCKCDCGNITYVPTSNLREGHTTSCGCQKYKITAEKLKLKLIGKRFGKLVVIKELPTINNESKWLCQCDCGNLTEATGWILTKGEKQSCGCLKSKGEQKIIEILTKSSIPFITQKTFSDCLSPNGVKLKFDFYINNQYLIEFDGEQHYMTIPNSLYSIEKLQQIKEYDNIKNEWCKKNNIPLIRIPYYKINTLNLKDLLLGENE